MAIFNSYVSLPEGTWYTWSKSHHCRIDSTVGIFHTSQATSTDWDAGLCLLLITGWLYPIRTACVETFGTPRRSVWYIFVPRNQCCNKPRNPCGTGSIDHIWIPYGGMRFDMKMQWLRQRTCTYTPRQTGLRIADDFLGCSMVFLHFDQRASGYEPKLKVGVPPRLRKWIAFLSLTDISRLKIG